MHCSILNPKGLIFSEEVLKVTLPSAQGAFQVLKNHGKVTTLLAADSELVLTRASAGEAEKRFAVSKGVAEVSDNKITVLLED